MKSDHKARSPVGSALNLGARNAQQPKPPRAQPLLLEVEDLPGKSMRDERGADPYNTSGSFDRTKNWQRVGKR